MRPPSGDRPVWVAFLRGMNLGRRRITNDALCAAFADLGCEAPTAFLASGNVIFGADAEDPDRLTARLESGLAGALGYEVPTLLRRDHRVRAIANRRPFADAELARGGKPQVLLFRGEPSAAARETVLELDSADDRLVLDARELYWLPRGGILDSELDLGAIERALGPTTMRTLRTLERLAAKLPDPSA